MFAAITAYTLATTSKLYSQGVPASLEEEIYSLESSYVTAYRGLRTERLLEEIDGNIWTPKGVCSASKRVDIAKLFARERFPQRASVVVIMGRARDVEAISAHPREAEVLFYRQQFTIRYLGRRQDLDIWGAIEVGLKVKPADNPAKEYPFPTLEECQGYVHKPTYKPQSEWIGNLPETSKSKYWQLSNSFSYYSFDPVEKLPSTFYEWYYKIGEDGLPENSQMIGEVEIYYQKKKEIWIGYKWEFYKSSEKYYYLQKDNKLLALKVDWSDDKYCYLDEDVFIK